MIYFTLIGWGLFILSFIVNILVIKFRRNSLIQEKNSQFTKKEHLSNILKEKYYRKEEELNEKIQRASNANDFIDIIANR